MAETAFALVLNLHQPACAATPSGPVGCQKPAYGCDLAR
jgi:hypothetical protein